MDRARRNRLTDPVTWWAMSAIALLAALLDILTRSPVEIAGVLVVIAALSVLGAALCTRHHRRASWPDSDTSLATAPSQVGVPGQTVARRRRLGESRSHPPGASPTRRRRRARRAAIGR
jgi:hypothetical protein